MYKKAVNKLSDVLSAPKRKKYGKIQADADARYEGMVKARKAKEAALREAKRQATHAEKVKKYNDKTKEFGVGWGH